MQSSAGVTEPTVILHIRPEGSNWGERLPFNDICVEFEAPYRGFVHDVDFSPSGTTLAFTAHDSTVSFVTPPSAHVYVQHDLNPFKSIMFLGEDGALGACFDNDPFLL